MTIKKLLITLFVILPFVTIAQKDSILSGVYEWKEQAKQTNGSRASAVLLEGKAYDMEWMQISANHLDASNQKINAAVPADQEHLVIVRSGSLGISLNNNSTISLGPGSIALLMPGEKISLATVGGKLCEFYVMKYRSKEPQDLQRAKSAGGSVFTNWNAIPFKPHDKGGRRDFFERPTAMCKRLEIHETTLNPGLKSHEPHTHKAEEIVLMMDGKSKMQIGENFYEGGAGALYYLGSNVPHALQNDSSKPCTYFAIQFE